MTPTLEQRVAQAVTPELIATFRAEGAVVVRGIYTPEEIEVLKSGIDANLAQPSARSKVASRPDDPGWFFEDFCNWQHNERYRAFITGSPAPTVAAALMGTSTVRLHHDHLLVKEPGTRQRTPWHQDQPYYNIEGNDNVSMWIPVDSVPLQSTLEFVAGSHKGPWLMPRTFMANEARWFPEGTLADLPDIEGNRAAYPIRHWAVEPGDMLCFRMLTLHAAGGSETRRRAFSIRFIGDDVRHAPRRWATSPDFPGLDKTLPAGAEMHHPLFPIVWTTEDGQLDRLA